MGGDSLSSVPHKILLPTDSNIRDCADALREGHAVVMPTETVYGLAANARNAAAVERIFALKRRPAENPLIVHVLNAGQARQVVAEWTAEAETLASQFWPGPLTLVLPKGDAIPSIVTGGLNTVAVRSPRHPVALRLIEEAALPLCAPSANAFMGLSPTMAGHVSEEIRAGVFGVLDGGPCQVGIESTVLDLCGPQPRLLRPGAISKEALEAALGRAVAVGPADGERRSPGQYPRHYSPTTPVELVDRLMPEDVGIGFGMAGFPQQRQLPLDPAGYAAGLYAALYELDALGGEVIRVVRPPQNPDWVAVWDRLNRAAGVP